MAGYSVPPVRTEEKFQDANATECVVLGAAWKFASGRRCCPLVAGVGNSVLGFWPLNLVTGGSK